MLMIRLRRAGTKGRPFYRVVVSESTKTPQARVVDIVGHYDPKTKPRKVQLDLPKVEEWLKKGARASETVMDIVRKERTKTAAATA